MRSSEEKRVCILETDPLSGAPEGGSAPQTSAPELRFSCTSELFDNAYNDPGPTIANIMQLEAGATSGSRSAASTVGAGIGMTVVRNQETIRSFLKAVAQALREKLLYVTKPSKVASIEQRLQKINKLNRDLSLTVTYKIRETASGVREVHVFREASRGGEGSAIAVIPVAGDKNVEEVLKNELYRLIMRGQIPD